MDPWFDTLPRDAARTRFTGTAVTGKDLMEIR
jgi:hypothetical protein